MGQIQDKDKHRKDLLEQRLKEWRAQNIIGFTLWQIEDPNKRFTLEAVNTKHGVTIIQVFKEGDFVIFKS